MAGEHDPNPETRRSCHEATRRQKVPPHPPPPPLHVINSNDAFVQEAHEMCSHLQVAQWELGSLGGVQLHMHKTNRVKLTSVRSARCSSQSAATFMGGGGGGGGEMCGWSLLRAQSKCGGGGGCNPAESEEPSLWRRRKRRLHAHISGAPLLLRTVCGSAAGGWGGSPQPFGRGSIVSRTASESCCSVRYFLPSSSQPSTLSLSHRSHPPHPSLPIHMT